MIDDENKMNILNPFAIGGSLPGARSDPYPFAKRSTRDDGPKFVNDGIEKGVFHAYKDVSFYAPEEESAACLAGITAGQACGVQTTSVKSCPLMRPLEPSREIEPDAGTGFLDGLYGNTLVTRDRVPVLVPRYCDTGDGCTKKSAGGRIGSGDFGSNLGTFVGLIVVAIFLAFLSQALR
jgi:hypothetical protein